MFPVISNHIPAACAFIPRSIVANAVTISGFSIILISTGILITSIIAVAIVALLIIRHINSKEVIYSTLSKNDSEIKDITYSDLTGNDSETEEKKEEILKDETQDIIQDVLEESKVEIIPEIIEEYDYYNSIQENRTRDIYNLNAPTPRKLSIKQPSHRILNLQQKLFTRTKSAPERITETPKLIHLTRERPRPPGRAPTRNRINIDYS